MKLTKRILVIDDKDQETILEELHSKLDKDFDLHAVGIRTSKPIYRQKDKNKLDIEKLKLEIETAYDSEGWFELVLTDFDLNEEGNVDGLDVVEYIKSVRPSAPVMMYSGNFSKAIKKVINKEGTLTDDEVVKAVTKLVDYNIIKFIERTEYKKEAVDYLKGDKEISLRGEFLSLLKEHKDLIFNSCYPDFKGKSFGEIAKIIESHSDARSEEWLSALIKQTIAYLVQINKL